jgi:hypothetical protein
VELVKRRTGMVDGEAEPAKSRARLRIIEPAEGSETVRWARKDTPVNDREEQGKRKGPLAHLRKSSEKQSVTVRTRQIHVHPTHARV